MPLSNSCSLSAFNSNFKRERKKRGIKQALAISYKKLKDVCGVRSKRHMTPKQIVAKGKS